MFENMLDLMFGGEFDTYVFDTATKKKVEADPLMDYLVNFRERMGRARQLLTDPALTAFFFVTLAEALFG